jgi:hypothetical protein
VVLLLDPGPDRDLALVGMADSQTAGHELTDQLAKRIADGRLRSKRCVNQINATRPAFTKGPEMAGL